MNFMQFTLNLGHKKRLFLMYYLSSIFLVQIIPLLFHYFFKYFYLKVLNHQRTILSLVHKCITFTPMYSYLFYL